MKYFLLILLCLAAVTAFRVFRSEPENGDLREQEALPASAEVRKFMDQALALVRNNDSKGFFRLMSAPDEVAFEGYREMLFAGGDFCPAAVTGTVRLKSSTRELVSVLVKSEPRSAVYRFELILRKGGCRIVSVSRDSNGG